MRNGTLAAALSFALSGCTCGLVPALEGAPCEDGNICPEGFLCQQGVCQSIDAGSGGGAGGGAGGGGGGGANLCQNVTCTMPPASSCKDPNTLTTYTGLCNPLSGTCNYTAMQTTCQSGCSNGSCVGEMCAGIVCNQPPAPHCDNGSAVTSTSPGTCSMGVCKYDAMTMDCGGRGCADGACIGAGQTFTQVLPRVRHLINAIDQAPGSMGANVVVVGPAGALSSWNGTAWTQSPVAGNATDLTSVWFPNANVAYVSTGRGLSKWNGTQLSAVSGFPSLSGNGKPIDVHGRSESDLVVADTSATVYRLSGGNWTTTTQSGGSGPYAMNGVYVDAAGHIAVYGACNGDQCIVYSGAGLLYAVRTNDSGSFSALGPSLDATSGTHTYLWAGADNETINRFDSGAVFQFFDTTDVPTLSGTGPVAGIIGGGAGATSTFVWVLTSPSSSTLGSLYRITDPNATQTALSNTFYNAQHLSKNDSSGVVFVDTDTTGGGSTIVHRSATVDEALDVGAESWAAVAAAGTGFVLLNGFGDIAASLGAPTFQLHRTRESLTALDVAAGSAYALLVGSVMGSSGATALAQKVPLTQGSTYVDLTVPDAPTALNGVCRVSDTEWYAVGDFGSIYVFDGSKLTEMHNPATESLKDVDCGSSGVAVTCGDNGTVLKLSGTTWTTVSGAPQGNFTSCRLIGNAVYVAGDGVFAKYSNAQWTTLTAPTTLTALVPVSANEIYAASGAQVVRFNGSAWSMSATAPQTLVGGGLVGSHVVFAGKAGVVMEGQ